MKALHCVWDMFSFTTTNGWYLTQKKPHETPNCSHKITQYRNIWVLKQKHLWKDQNEFSSFWQLSRQTTSDWKISGIELQAWPWLHTWIFHIRFIFHIHICLYWYGYIWIYPYIHPHTSPLSLHPCFNVQEADRLHSRSRSSLAFPWVHPGLPILKIQANLFIKMWLTWKITKQLSYRIEKKYMEPFIVIGPVLIGGGVMTVFFSVEVRIKVTLANFLSS